MEPEPKAIVEFPEPINGSWVDPPDFSGSMRLHMNRHHENAHCLAEALNHFGGSISERTIRGWTKGSKPATRHRLGTLWRIERRYQLPNGYFEDKLVAERRLRNPLLAHFRIQRISQVRWHIPEDFSLRSEKEQQEIVQWVNDIIVVGGTDYRAYAVEWSKRPYALWFPECRVLIGLEPSAVERRYSHSKTIRAAPAVLIAEMSDYLKSKTSVLTPVGERRSARWNEQTANQVLKRSSLMFGALSASHDGELRGLGLHRYSLTMTLLVVPAVWDWYINWHFQKRGFFSLAEVELMDWAASLVQPGTGWLRQRPDLATTLRPVPDLLNEGELDAIRSDWAAACHRMYLHARQRRKDLHRIARIHRDTFEPIRPILTSDNPLGEYRRIAEEIIARMPPADHDPYGAAEAIRGYLMLRLGLHLGLRQRNLRDLLYRPRGSSPSHVVRLESLCCGELRWNEDAKVWEVFVPATAFKNASSSFFDRKPFLMTLPDLGGLYGFIESYMHIHRQVLLGSAKDPGTFFVKTVRHRQCNPRFDQHSYYKAFRTVTERYGVYNPYTKRGAIKDLLPHGPHSVRAVLATHILKQTGSFLQASYAIQDVPATVEYWYGRFLPQDKSRIAARILDAEWV